MSKMTTDEMTNCQLNDEIVAYHKEPGDYAGDLNVMHALEKKLLFSRRKAFREELQAVMSQPLAAGARIAIDECIHATARQRAEAMVRLIRRL